MSKIQKNSHGLQNWELRDLNGVVQLETTRTLRGNRIDGVNIGVEDASGYKGSTWLSVEEAQSLRRWLNETLDTTA